MLSRPLLPSDLQHKFVKVSLMFKDRLIPPLLLAASDVAEQDRKICSHRLKDHVGRPSLADLLGETALLPALPLLCGFYINNIA